MSTITLSRREFLLAGAAAVAAAVQVGLPSVRGLPSRIRRGVDLASGPDETGVVAIRSSRFRGVFSQLKGQDIQPGDVVYHAGRFMRFDVVKRDNLITLWHELDRKEVGEMESPWVHPSYWQHVFDNPIVHPGHDVDDLTDFRCLELHNCDEELRGYPILRLPVGEIEPIDLPDPELV